MNWILIVVILILVALIGLSVLLFFFFKRQDRNQVQPLDPSSFRMTNFYYWDSQPSNDFDKNFCQTYNIYPPTLKSSVLDNVPGSALSCYYGDQTIAQNLTRTCRAQEVKGASGFLNLCVKEDGTQAKEGESESYYDSSLCLKVLTPCPGELGVLALPFFISGSSSNGSTSPSEIANHCLTPAPDASFSDSPCSLDVRSMLFNSANYSYGFKGFYQDNGGPFSQLVSRENGQCLNAVGASLSTSPCSSVPEWVVVPDFSLFFFKDTSSNVYTGPVTPGAPLPTGSTGATVIFPQSYALTSSIDLSILPNLKTLPEVANYLYNTETVKVLSRYQGNYAFLSYAEVFRRLSPTLPSDGILYPINANFINYQLFNLIKSTTS